MRLIRRITALIAALAAGCAMTVAIAPSAVAADWPTCNAWSWDQVLGQADSFARVPSVGQFTGRINCQLKLGDFDNTGVAVLQWLSLNTCHGAGLEVDGDYGPLTSNAVKFIQAGSHLPPADGVYEPGTRRFALRWAAWHFPGETPIGCQFVR
ncbi:MAG TPA: hypothetical protein VGR06_39885 [Actinophytocola sp.]|uniref:peptidoglycan-binding domain-containing protein n=1 Tax=Actinophytocola sp. TaxID=1872138 RepID=UPI002DF87296|nr:hypothetical protein [Actinophytocola sp.]